jgi:hypothetical protein
MTFINPPSSLSNRPHHDSAAFRAGKGNDERGTMNDEWTYRSAAADMRGNGRRKIKIKNPK